jgi:hypothetical protein
MQMVRTSLIAAALLMTPAIATPQLTQAERENAMTRLFTGTLVDVDCPKTDPQASCDASPATRVFALVTTEGTFRLDGTGNRMAAEQIQKNKNKGKVSAQVKGVLENNVIRAESVTVSPS